MDTRDKNEFNFAVIDLNRLNYRFSLAEEAQSKLDADSWFNELNAIQCILSCYMDADENKGFDTRFNELLPSIEKINKTALKTGRFVILPEIYLKLKHIYIDLRKVAKEADLLGRPKDEASRALR